MPIVVKIKLVQVNFVPTWYAVDDDGEITSSKRTAIGQLALDCTYLPETLQCKLRELIAEQYKHTLEERDAAKNIV